jgi:hypothetical protein
LRVIIPETKVEYSHGRVYASSDCVKRINLKREGERKKNEIMKLYRNRSASLGVMTAINKCGNIFPPNSLHKRGIITNVKHVLTLLEHHTIL